MKAKHAAKAKPAAPKKAAKTASPKKAADKNTAENEKAYKEFKSLVNMTASSLEKWLNTPDSKGTGLDSGDGEAIGHKSGKAIVDILRKKKADLTETDYEQMHRTISYISRHTAQRPDGDVAGTRWNFSLKNWGYDYSKDKKDK